MSDRSSWATTTHDWADDVDHAHLETVRHELSTPGASGGVRHLILEVLAYAQDEAAATGRRGNVIVTLHPDGSVGVDDDGRGTDTRTDEHGHPVRKPVMATPDVRFTDPTTSPVLPDGRPRRGISTVAALSEVLTHENHRTDGAWSQTYRRGIPDAELTAVPPRGRTGTVVTFLAHVDGPDRPTDQDLTGFPDLTVQVTAP
ncbi:ATP-binding protein [Kytococcus sp. Marseille-QA3725]